MATKAEKQAILERVIQARIFEVVDASGWNGAAAYAYEQAARVMGFGDSEMCEVWDVARDFVKERPCGKLRQCVAGCHACKEFSEEYAKSRMEKRLTRWEYLEILEGQEVLSVHFEQCVGIKDGQIWARGEIICEEPTDEELRILFRELMDYELCGALLD